MFPGDISPGNIVKNLRNFLITCLIPVSIFKTIPDDKSSGKQVERESFHKRRKLQSDLESLKKSVTSLHQKDLFPYNTEVLLRWYVRVLDHDPYHPIASKIAGYSSLLISGGSGGGGRIVLSTEDKLPFLEPPIPVLSVPPLGQANPPNVIATHQAWVKAQKEIDGLMLMTMDPEIQKTLDHLCAYDMLKELKMLYVQQADQELLQTGCEELVKHDTLTKPDKLDPRSIKSIFVGYPKETIRYSFYYPPENKDFVTWNAKFLKNGLINHDASGSINDLEIIQDEDTHPSLDTSLNHEKHDQEIDEPQSDTKPIRRSTRTHHLTDGLCLYIDAEEHELGDLCEPANYKATLFDPESDKWLNSMNVDMQSMKGNEVWELVVLPPNGKVIGHTWIFKKKTDINGAVPTYKARLSPGDAHWTAVKNIMKYLRNTKDMFLVYGGDMKRKLRVSYYTDTRYLTDADDMKS
nr:hypothetical protein [Tanacetum cinerariifolium]